MENKHWNFSELFSQQFGELSKMFYTIINIGQCSGGMNNGSQPYD